MFNIVPRTETSKMVAQIGAEMSFSILILLSVYSNKTVKTK